VPRSGAWLFFVNIYPSNGFTENQGRLPSDASITFAIGTPFAHSIYMKALREYGRILTVYMSFIAFVAVEIVAIVWIYRYIGVI
jgi:hypothetical protein